MSNSANVVCATLGHTWVIRPKGGRLTELCSTCGATPEEEA